MKKPEVAQRVLQDVQCYHAVRDAQHHDILYDLGTWENPVWKSLYADLFEPMRIELNSGISSLVMQQLAPAKLHG